MESKIDRVIQKQEPSSKKLYIESYGCQMNFSDSEVVASILKKTGYETTENQEDSNVILLNTCSIRDNAEQKIRNRLISLQKIKKKNPKIIIGILGCMAERLKTKLLEEEKLIDLIAGPDSYRSLPNLIEEVNDGQKAVNVLLSREETYADISPIKLDKNGVTAFISIMRGCDNMCSFCVVPFTRGRERSRNPETIINEATELFKKGYRDITLLGQNVDSYKWNKTSKGKIKDFSIETVNFAQLLEKVAKISSDLRIRFSTSNPKDMTDDVLYAIANHENICNYIHLPVQSGNSQILHNMNRGYSREWYLEKIRKIREIIPNCAISTDIIVGFCGETQEQYNDTVSLMKEVKYNYAYMFKYSERPKTLAERKYKDNVPDNIKGNRLKKIITIQLHSSLKYHQKEIGKTHKVLIEKVSKKDENQLFGRNSQNTGIVFQQKNYKKGQYVNVKITSCTAATLIGKIV